jgi:hypothetical protein
MPPDPEQAAAVVAAVKETFPGAEQQTDFDALTKRAADAPNAWLPEPGETLVGTVEAPVVDGESEYGLYPMLEVRDTEGHLFSVHCFHTTLRNAIDQLAPKVGEAIAIKYFGRQASKTEGHDDIYLYRVVVDR